MKQTISLVALPEPSFPYLLANIGSYQKAAFQKLDVPIDEQRSKYRVSVIIDRQDYQRVRRLATESPKHLHVFLALTRLCQLGIVQTYHYPDYITGSRFRRKTPDRNTRLVDSLSSHEVQNLTIQGQQNWVRTARSEFQEQIRRSMDVDIDSFIQNRKEDRESIKKLKRGGGSRELAQGWIEKVLHRAAAAGCVRKELDEATPDNVSVAGIVAGPAYTVAETVAASHEKSHLIEYGINRRLVYPSKHTKRISLKFTPQISEMAERTVEGIGPDVQGFVLGPQIGFVDLLHPKRVRWELEHEDNIEAQAEEAIDKICPLPTEHSMSELRYISSYIIEEAVNSGTDMLQSIPWTSTSKVLDAQVPFPIEYVQRVLSNKIRTLRLRQQIYNLRDEYSHAALLTAATVLIDPRYNHNYQSKSRLFGVADALRQQFLSPREEDEEWAERGSKLNSWTGPDRWYEFPNTN
jgi:hypothetical protein